MPLAPGTWLGQYEILSLLGVGGMGEVYHARDSKLVREVALKVLPKAFARDPERLARFRREAQLLAQLSHPNIAGIYNLETSGETHFLVLEYVPGETLRERIKRGSTASPVPLEEALDICKQICEALDHAHEKTIIHRDLKPANVKVTPAGQVKVLDFGLAKAFAGDTPSSDPGDSPTIHASPTMPGVILGTAAYMSPQQARGKTVDKRADIWALGCVLYELLTGKQAFPGEDVPDILAAVVKGEPDWQALPATTPPSVRVLLRRCLEKDQKRRFRDACDLEIQLEEAAAVPASTPAIAPAIAPSPVWRRALPWGVAALLSIGVGLAVWSLKPTSVPEPRPVTRFVMTLPSGDRLFGNLSLNQPSIAVSPDGGHLAYVAIRGGIQQLYLRDMDGLEAKPISGTEGAGTPFFSPDGQWIGYSAAGSLKKVSISGGASLTLCSAPALRGASWGPDDTIFFSPDNSSGLSKVPAAGGAPQVVTTPDAKKGESTHRWPEVLPGGKALLFVVAGPGGPDTAQVVAQALETGERRLLVQGGTYPHYSSSGHLLYYRAGTLMAVPFEPDRLEVKGTPAPVLEGISATLGGTGSAHFGISRIGSLVYVPGGVQGVERTLVWVDRKGALQPLGAPPRAYAQPGLSPDGRQLAVTIEIPKSDIWVYDIPRGTLTRLTFDGNNSRPLWTPDGNRIAFSSNRGGSTNLFWKPADGTGAEEQITKSEQFFLASSVSLDGKRAFFVENNPSTGQDLWTVPLEGERKPTLFLQTPFNETVPRISPDGRWLAYVSNEAGRAELYVRAYPGPGGKWQISTEGGGQPLWARNGRELFYRSGDKMMAVDIATEPTFKAGTPRVLFEGSFEPRPGAGTNFEITPDGQRFVMIKTGGTGAAFTQLNVVLNWFEELKKRVPTGR